MKRRTFFAAIVGLSVAPAAPARVVIRQHFPASSIGWVSTGEFGPVVFARQQKCSGPVLAKLRAQGHD